MTQVADPRDADEIALRLGLEGPWMQFEGGSAGAIHAIEGGQVMKLTNNVMDAAVCLAIKEAQDRGGFHPAIPRMHDVRWMSYTLEIDAPTVDGKDRIVVEDSTSFVIVRDAADDVEGQLIPEALQGLWSEVVRHIRVGWEECCSRSLDEAKRLWMPYGRDVEQIVDGLEWLRRETGVKLLDIRLSNLGETFYNTVGLRDFGCAEVPEDLLKRVKAREFEAVPELPAPGLKR